MIILTAEGELLLTQDTRKHIFFKKRGEKSEKNESNQEKLTKKRENSYVFRRSSIAWLQHATIAREKRKIRERDVYVFLCNNLHTACSRLGNTVMDGQLVKFFLQDLITAQPKQSFFFLRSGKKESLITRSLSDVIAVQTSKKSLSIF